MELPILIGCLSLALIGTVISGNCKSGGSLTDAEECDKGTVYENYVECMRRRAKRSTDCQESACSQCDCDYCAVNICDTNCESCCVDKPSCKNKRCCHKTCHFRCKDVPCRTDCRRNCTEKVVASHDSVESADNSTTSVVNKPRHNITTIIELHNVINNTNEIQIPIQVNTTNLNNFTLENPTDQTRTTGAGEETLCCHVISPRQCVPKQEYPFVRCFHLRKKACGSFCQAPTLLEQTHEVCEQTDNGTSCHQQVVYVPHQDQRNCNFHPAWPYITCGTPQFYNPQNQMVPMIPPIACPGGLCYNNWNNYYQPGPSYANYPAAQGAYGYGVSPYSIPSTFSGGYPYYPVEYEGGSIAASTTNESVSTNKQESTPTTGFQYQYPPVVQPFQPYYPIQMTPLGYPYPSQVPIYYLPPEVDIQATVAQPEKVGRYAQITITDKETPDPNSITDGINKVKENEI